MRVVLVMSVPVCSGRELVIGALGRNISTYGNAIYKHGRDLVKYVNISWLEIRDILLREKLS